MASRTHIVTARKEQRAGLAHFMARVLKERDHAAKKLDADSVHDLRVALRRCRTMADALSTLDPEKSLRAMKKASRRTFRSLGQLRDVQVMREWIKKLAPAGDPLASRLLESLAQSEAAAKAEAAAALNEFDVAQMASLVARSRRTLASSCLRTAWFFSISLSSDASKPAKRIVSPCVPEAA